MTVPELTATVVTAKATDWKGSDFGCEGPSPSSPRCPFVAILAQASSSHKGKCSARRLARSLRAAASLAPLCAKLYDLSARAPWTAR